MINNDFETEYLDEILNNPSSSAHLDSLVARFPSEDLVDKGIRGGAIEAFSFGVGENRSGVGVYIPGIHRDLEIIPSSLADEETPVMARNPRSRVVPFSSHLVLDMPRRATEGLSGDYRYKSVANYMLALSRHVSNTTGSELSVYVNNGESAGLIFEGDARDAYMAEPRMDGEPTVYVEETEASLAGLLRIVEARTNPNFDGVFIVSDFQDVFNPDAAKFDWQDDLNRMSPSLNDRMWITKVTSPAHRELPVDAVEGLDIATVTEINSKYANQAEDKAKILDEIMLDLGQSRVQEVDLKRDRNPDHPVNIMTEFVLGQVYN